MNSKLRTAIVLIAGLLAVCCPMWAHHGNSAYDEEHWITITGRVTEFVWANPHCQIFMDVKDDKGNVTNWGFSASPPGMLQRRGITKNSLKLGDVLTITGHRAKDGSNNASGNVVTFPDGHDARIGQDQALNPTEAAPDAGKKQ